MQVKPMTDCRFPKGLRLLRASEFERVFAARNSAANTWFVFYGAANDVGHPRLGITVSRRIGGAVERNRWKRLLREAFRLSQHDLPALDYICVVRAPAPPTLRNLIEALPQLAGRIEGRIKKASRISEKPEQKDP
jgi:ribonuclease P protein component